MSSGNSPEQNDRRMARHGLCIMPAAQETGGANSSAIFVASVDSFHVKTGTNFKLYVHSLERNLFAETNGTGKARLRIPCI
jgi:hypothetical protein